MALFWDQTNSSWRRNPYRPMNSSARLLPRLALLSSVLFSGLARAQVAPAAPPAKARPPTAPAPAEVSAPREEPVQLNAFEVASDRDYGYLATNASTATGSGAAVRDTPMSITILTEDFLRDKNIIDVQEALRNVSSMTAEGKEENVVTSRGFASVMKMDGNEVEGFYDAYNVGRIEVIKGAVSVLQGRASAGGVVNVISRRPRFTRETQVRASYGSYDYYLGSVMTTGPLLGGRVAYLVGLTKMDRADGFVDWTYRRDNSTQFALAVKPFKTVTITADYQRLTRHENNAQHLTFSHPAFVAADLEAQRLYDTQGRTRPTQYPRIGETTRAWLDRTPGFGPNTPAETIDVMELMYPSGYRANIQGPEQFRINDTTTIAGEIQWRIASWVDWKSTYSVRARETDSINWSTFRAAGGLTMNARATRSKANSAPRGSRHEAAMRFAFWNVHQRILTGFEYQDGKTQTRTLNGPAATPYNPRTGPLRYLQREIDLLNPNGFPAKRLTNASTAVRSYYLMDQMETWENRVNLMFGARQSSQRRGTVSAQKFTPQIGGVLRIPRHEAVSVYATYSESYRPNFNRDGLGNPIPPVEEVNREAGVKVKFLDGRISGSAAVYRLEQKNVSLRDYAREAALGITGLYILSGLARSEGAETEWVISPWRNYQIVTSYSRIWLAKTVKAEDIRQQGVRLLETPESQFAFWNKYTFTGGRWKGTHIGTGLRWTGVMRIHPSWESPIDARPYWYGDLTAGYPLRVRRTQVDVSLNVKNLFDKFYFNQTFRSGDPRQIYVMTSAKF